MRVLILLMSVVLLACGGFELPKELPSLPAPPTPPSAPPPVASPAPLGDPAALPLGENLTDPVAAYTADCHASLGFIDEATGDTKLRCDVPFEQSCAPDNSGCWSAHEQCQAACVSPCGTCQDACALPCDGCVAKCAPGDEACRTACGASRAACGQTCMIGRQVCLDRCDSTMRACDESFQEKLDRLCPDCQAIGACLNQQPACTPTDYPNDAKECFEWCYLE